MPGTFYRVSADRLKWKSPGYPDIIPGSVTPPPSTNLPYGVTLFGQSMDHYKGISSLQDSYDAVENETVYVTPGGVTRKGGAVSRKYSNSGDIEDWAQTISQIRAGQPLIYSWKYSAGNTISSFKSELRTWLDSKPDTSQMVWLVHWHEPTDDWLKASNPGGSGAAGRTWWVDRQVAAREVLNEAAYVDRTDVRFGPIFTRNPFVYAGTNADNVITLWNRVNTELAGARDCWDFIGGDFYNPPVDGAKRYQTLSDWRGPLDKMHNTTGLNWIIGEGGTAVPFNRLADGTQTYNYGTVTPQTRTQLNKERATWVDMIYNGVRDSGACEAFCWWRRPNLNDPPPTPPYDLIGSSLGMTPAGYDAITDDPYTLAVHSQACIESIQQANATIPFYT